MAALTVDGVPVPGVLEVWDGALAPPRRRGGPVALPGRDGALHAPGRPYDATAVSFGVQLHAGDAVGAEARAAAILAAWEQLLAVVDPDPDDAAPLVLALSLGGATRTARALLAEVGPVVTGTAVARVTLTFTLLDGGWS